jgi:hypothetical protein
MGEEATSRGSRGVSDHAVPIVCNLFVCCVSWLLLLLLLSLLYIGTLLCAGVLLCASILFCAGIVLYLQLDLLALLQLQGSIFSLRMRDVQKMVRAYAYVSICKE